MLLDDLVGAIETIKERIRTHKQNLQINETRTRMALIDPLLQALEWDPADPALVTPEYPSGSGPVDYALRGSGDKPAAFIEAKKLGESLVKYQEQMVRYANMEGIPYAGLTDGDYWEFYEVFKQERLEDRRLLQVSITHDPTHECALKLLLLWRSNMVSGQPTPANEPIFAAESEPEPVPAHPEPVKATPSTPESYPEPTKAAPSSAPEPKDTKWVALSDMFRGRSPSSSGDPPLAIKFPDESENGIRLWKDVLVNTAEWLYSKGLLSKNVPVLTMKKGHYIVNIKKEHPDGSPFERPQRLKEGLWVEARGGQKAIRNTRHLLRACGQNPAEVLTLVALRSDKGGAEVEHTR